MTGHPSARSLESFMVGDLSPAENRNVVRHLLAGCDACSEKTSALWEVAVTGRAAPKVDASEYEQAFDRAWDGASRLHAKICEERKAADGLVRDLFELTPRQQRLRIRNDRRLQTLAVCDAVVAATEGSAFNDAGVACSQADLAREISEHLDASVYGAGTVADAKASAWATYANALRNTSDYSGAVRALETARMFLDEGTGDPIRKAKFLAHLGSLLRARSRMAEALSVFDELERIYASLGDRHMVGRVQLKKAIVHHKSREPERVIPVLAKALQLLDPARDPRRQTIALHNLVLALIEAGRLEEAANRIDELRRLHQEQGGRLNLVRFRWLEGRLAYALGELETAQERFVAVRNAFVELEIGIDAALASLDLAQVLFDRGLTSETRQRLGEAIPILKALGVHAQAMAAVAFLEKALRVEAEGAELIRRTAAFVRKVQDDPSIRFRPSEVGVSGRPAAN